MKKTELLLPVGDMNMLLAAIHHGADAVYMGVPYFNARGRSQDFSFDDLKEMIDLAHLYGVKVNLAFNVVIFENEIPKVREVLENILPMGPDAFIVQDLGLAKIIREMAPQQRIHASTQMTVTNADAMELLSDLKIDRFVLGRENSLPEIELIRSQTDKELEVFVHGALCVAYSGQCFTSESIGGRSANRGQCAQSCRLDYELWVDDQKKDMGNKKYLVSPKDLMGIEEVPRLKEIGVDSFKIEGRLKAPEYVAATAHHYRQVLDGESIDLERRRQELATTYSRGFFTGWLHGVDHQNLVDATYSSHRGIKLGEVLNVKNKTIAIKSEIKLHAGQGLLIVYQGQEVGSKIFSVKTIGDLQEIELVGKVAIEKGSDVYLNSDEVLARKWQKGWSSREFQKRISINLEVTGVIGSSLKAIARDPEGRTVEVISEVPLSVAESRPVSGEMILDELKSLGSTAYILNNVSMNVDENIFIHNRALKNMRREMVEKLNKTRLSRDNVMTGSFPELVKEKANIQTPKLNILLRTKKQVEELAARFESILPLKDFIATVILDFEFGKDYGPSIEILRSFDLKVALATTRILKPKEYYNLNTIIRHRPDYILVRNLGALNYLKAKTNIPLIGDFSLNITNSYSLDYILSKGLESVNMSYDLNQEQLLDVVRFNPTGIEVTIHQYMPEFHMEHCVFAAFLSQGHSFKDCGKPCESHELKLKDPYNNWHYLKADQECRNTFFKATPQSASFMIDELKNLGVARFRLEALNEDGDSLLLKVKTYLELIAGRIDSQEVVSRLKMVETYGLSTGQLDRKDAYKDRKQLRT